MTQRMSIWGIGPMVGRPTFFYVAVAVLATFVRPSWFAIDAVDYPYLAAAGGLLLAIGVLLIVMSLRTLLKARREDKLATTGPYAVCRHPLYAAWILLILPGAAFLLRSWPVLIASLLMYVLTRIYVGREEENLETLFGQQYLDYKTRVNAIFPAIRART